jgi:hypothetical protein
MTELTAIEIRNREIWEQWGRQEEERIVQERSDRYFVAWNNLFNAINEGRQPATASNINRLWRYATQAADGDRFQEDYMAGEIIRLSQDMGY